jgi:hypothetical protein
MMGIFFTYVIVFTDNRHTNRNSSALFSYLFKFSNEKHDAKPNVYRNHRMEKDHQHQY